MQATIWFHSGGEPLGEDDAGNLVLGSDSGLEVAAGHPIEVDWERILDEAGAMSANADEWPDFYFD